MQFGLHAMQGELQDMQFKLHDMQEALSGLQGVLHGRQDALHGLQGAPHEMQDDLHEMQGALHEMQDDLQEMQGVLQDKQDELQGMQRGLHDLQSGRQPKRGMAQAQGRRLPGAQVLSRTPAVSYTTSRSPLRQPTVAPHKPHSLRNDLLLIGVTLLAAAGWMFSRQSLQGMPPLWFLCIRFLLAGVILVVVGGSRLRELSPAQWRRAVALGLLFGVGMMIWILGLQHSRQVGEAAFIASMNIVLVPLYARFLFRDRLLPSTWLAIPVAVGGLALLSLDRGVQLETGQLLILTSACVFALHFNLIARRGDSIDAIALTAVQLCLTGLASGVAAMGVETFPTRVSPATWGWIVAAAVLASSARFLLQNYTQARVEASHGAVIMVLEPVWTTLLACTFLGESMTRLQMAGCTLIFSAMLVSRWPIIHHAIRGPDRFPLID